MLLQLKKKLQPRMLPQLMLLQRKSQLLSQRNKTHKIPMMKRLLPLKKSLKLPLPREQQKPYPTLILVPLKPNMLILLKTLRTL